MLGRYRYEIVVGLLLVVSTLAVFWHACDNEFVNFDDTFYVSKNPYLKGGLGRQTLLWAFTTFHAGNWHPLTWISLLLDYQLHGTDPRGYHLTNILLHAANVLLLLIVLRQMTRALWRSALVAVLFAVHPLHVESVAWVAERKDVLCTFFGMLSLWAYTWYAVRPSWGRYLAVVGCYALSLMAKPMLVTLPLVLLLLDYWGLQRFRLSKTGAAPPAQTQERPNGAVAPLSLSSFGFCFREKIPLFILAACSCLVTCYAQQEWQSIQSFEDFPLRVRLENAVVSYAAYIGKMLWPTNLAVFYPHPGDTLSGWQVGAAALLLIAVSAFALKLMRRCPYLLVGWLWYLGTLVPVIGLVQVGSQGMADRYAYVPLIGLSIIFAWGIVDFADSLHWRPLVIVVLEGTLVSACALASWLQVHYWRNSITLWKHALEVTEKNWVAHLNLGVAMERQGSKDKAAEHYAAALRIAPHNPTAHNNLGVLVLSQGKLTEAVEHLSEAVERSPTFIEGHNNLASALARQGKTQLAVEHYEIVLRLRPQDAGAHYNLGLLLSLEGRVEDALVHFDTAVRIYPEFWLAHNNLGVTLAEQGKQEEAMQHFRTALRINPNYADAHYNLGQAYYQDRNVQEAMACFRRAVQLKPAEARHHASLALVLHDQGQADAAATEYQEALRLDPQWPEDANRVAWTMATDLEARRRNGRLALQLAQQACQATGNQQARFLDTLAAAYAALGRYDEAVTTARRALALASSAQDALLVKEIKNRLKQYERRQPYRDGPAKTEP